MRRGAQTVGESIYDPRVRSIVAGLLCCCVCAVPAVAQDDAIARARAAAADGRRAEGIALLEQHLTTTPRDVDARLVYGLILAWDGNYDAARVALGEVLAEAPDYLDARVALMNVEWWSGRLDAARDLNRAVLARDPGNPQARLVKQRLDARRRPWNVGVMFTGDSFSDDRDAWQELSLTLERETPLGTMFLRGSRADRFGLTDEQVDLEFYPVFRAGTYAFVGVGMGADDLLYPGHRLSFDLYQSLGRGFEISGGMRHLAFAEPTDLYVATLSKYIGNWMLTGKASVVPDQVVGDAWSYHGTVRRYFGGSGASYFGAGYSYGFSREEPRGAGDLIRVVADTVRAQFELDLPRLTLSLSASTSREERPARDALWQTTAGAGVSVRF